MSHVITTGAYNFVLTIDGVDVGFHLMKDESGALMWREGLAEKYAPQQRTQAFSYEHVPPDVDQPLAGEDWFGGAGYDSVRNSEGTVTTARYSYSRGVNASHSRKLMLAHRLETALESDGTAIAAAPNVFCYSPTLGLFAAGGQYIYEFDISTTTWVQRSTTAAGANIRSIKEHDGKLFAATGSATDYYYSSDGVTWTAFTAENENADFFETRSNVLWKLLGQNIKNSTDGTIAGWSGTDKLGHTSMTVAGLVQTDGSLWGFYREGIIEYTGSAVNDVWRAPVVISGNGANPCLGGDGFIYAPYGPYIMRLDPTGSGNEPPLTALYPFRDIRSNIEITGRTTAIAVDELNVFAAVVNGAGNTYIMKGDPTTNEWHTWVYMGTTGVTALKWVPAGVAHTSNPCLMVGTDAPAARFIILPRMGYTPDTDLNCRFETTGTIYGSNWDFGAQAFPKFLNGGNLAGTGISAANSVELFYDIDNSGSNVSIMELVYAGFMKTDIHDKVTFNVVRPVLTLSGGTPFNTPVCTGFALHATPNPPRKRMWNLTIMLANNMPLADGGIDDQDVRWVKDMLQIAWNDRPTLVDRSGNTSHVIVRDVQGRGIHTVTIGGEERDVEVIDLSLVEVTRLTGDAQEAIYGQDAYGGGRVYG